jgi:hypothetical protein
MLVQQDNAITPIVASATSGGAAAIAPALAATAGKTNFLEGFTITGSGATGASVIEASITGLNGGTIYYELPIVAGVNLGAFPLTGNEFWVNFPEPIPATGADVAITLHVPSFGSGNTNSAAVLYGFQK